MTSDIHVRPARLTDQETIVRYNCGLARETESKTLEPSVVSAGVAAVLSDPAQGLYFVAEIGGRVAGQLMLTFEWSDWRNSHFWWLQSVYVDQSFRNRGVFRALMRDVAARAESDPACCGLRLYVHRHNEPALQTYRKLGFYQLEYEFYELGGKYPR